MVPDGFEWDPRKADSNLVKHGVDFAAAARIFDGLVLQRQDGRREYGEARIIAVGEAEGVCLTIVWVRRGENRRIISAWRASRNTRALYQAWLRHTRRPD